MITPGMRFGRLRALYAIHGMWRYVMWCCECDCGQSILRAAKNIASGQIKSCGCLRRQVNSERFRQHGQYKSKTYKSWAQMIQRCRDKNNLAYGGRGIRVCEAWLKFEAFYADMGDRPEGKTLDRMDVNGNYEPGNCRWATRAEQDRNKSSSLTTTYNGQKITAAELSDLTGISRSTTRRQILAGFTFKGGIWVEGNQAQG